MELREYRYATGALLKDYAGAVIGLTVFGGPALFVPLSSVMVMLLGGLGLLFAFFAVRTVIRQFSTLVVDNQGIRVIGPRPQAVEWQELSVVRLKFFSTWRDRKSGWMQLSVKGKGGVILVDQALGDFQQLADIVFMVARNHGLSFDRNTRQNAESLGLDPGPDEAS